jgi:hypothetical protein
LTLSQAQLRHVEDTEAFLNLMLRSRQWDGLDSTRVERWLGNFDSDLLRYYALRILRRVVYYSEMDGELLLREALLHRVIGAEIRRTHQVASSFGRLPSFLESEFKRTLPKTLLVPLMDSGKPSESSPAITRIAAQRLNVPTESIHFPEKVTKSDLAACDRVVLVDDNVGSGQQFRAFWNTFEVASGERFQDLLKSAQKPLYYVVLVGTSTALTDLRADHPNIRFCATQELTPDYEVFAPDSLFWGDPTECTAAKALIDEHLKSRGIPLLGWASLGYAVVFHRTIPDWSLPMFWQGNENWHPVLERKNSYE